MSTNSESDAAGGGIVLLAKDLVMDDGSVIRASNTGIGDAGNIHMETGDTVRLYNAKVLTEAAAGSGGSITLLTTKSLELNRSTLSTSVLGKDGDGGNIFIDPYLVLMQNSRVTANAVFGNGGNININAGILMVDANTLISASSQFGVDGEVAIDAPILPVRNNKRLLKKKSTRLLRSRCMADRADASSFTVAGSALSGYTPDSGLVATRSDYSDSTDINVGERIQLAALCGS